MNRKQIGHATEVEQLRRLRARAEQNRMAAAHWLAEFEDNGAIPDTWKQANRYALAIAEDDIEDLDRRIAKAS